MTYKTFVPGEKVSSPKSTRNTLKVRNETDVRGKFSIKIGSSGTEQETLSAHSKKEFDVTDQAVVLVNKGDTDLEWLRS